MRVLVIPDIHLKPWMFEDAEVIMRSGYAERAVCLMDIPDAWKQEYNLDLYRETFEAAFSFQKAFPDTLWCYGNHDLSYLWRQPESGYSPSAAGLVCEELKNLREMLPDDSQLAYIHRIDNVLFLHGGLTEPFVNYYVDKDEREDTDTVIARINSMGNHEIWDEASPVWFRPQFYYEKMYRQEELLQVVGHTPVQKIYRDGSVVSCDVFSTYRDGSPIGTQEFLRIDTVTRELKGLSVNL